MLLNKKLSGTTCAAIAFVILSGCISIAGIPFLVLGFNSSIALPVAVQLVWIIAIVALLLWVGRLCKGSEQSLRCLRWLIAIMIGISLFVWQTEYPSIHGDGENAAPGFLTLEESLPVTLHNPEWRLSCLINRYFAEIKPDIATFEFHMGMPERNNRYQSFSELVEARRVYNDTWILLSLIAGVSLVITVLLLSHVVAATEQAKAGLILVALCAPSVLNMYGHFDSYWLSVGLVYAWGFFMMRVKMSHWPRVGCLLLISILGYWTHPLLLFLSVFTFALIFVHALYSRLSNRGLFILVMLTSMMIGTLPMFHDTAYAPEWNVLSGKLLMLFVAERFLHIVSTASPAIFLVLATIVTEKNYQRRISEPASLAMIMVASTCIAYFTLNFTLGPLDYLNMSILGAFILIGAIMMWLAGTREAITIVCAGIISLFVFTPLAYTNSNKLVFDYFRTVQPQSVCGVNRAYSPYTVLALRCPVDGVENQSRMLNVFKTGYETPGRLWERFSLLNRQYHTAWSYEFGFIEQGRVNLEWIFSHAPSSLPSLWFDGARLTMRHENRAGKIMRLHSYEIINEKLMEEPDDPKLHGMLVVLKKCETGDWTKNELMQWLHRVELRNE